jgi:glycosyltransferase involved in cell wall biosynthesis
VNPLVSVISGTFNREPYIRKTIDSVLAQDVGPPEILIVDDASTDRTVDILRAYGDRISVDVLPSNSGLPAVPRNVALRKARGRYIAFLDSDDLWKPGKLSKQIAFLENNPRFDWVHAYAEVIDVDDRVQGVRHGNGLPPSGDSFDALLRHCFISISTVLVRREVVEKTGLLNEDRFYRAREDYEWFLRVARNHPLGLVDEVLASYRRAPTGISAQDSTWYLRPEDAEMHLRVWQRRELWQDRTPEGLLREVFTQACLDNSIHWRAQHRRDRALHFCRLALRHTPPTLALLSETAKALLTSLFTR